MDQDQANVDREGNTFVSITAEGDKTFNLSDAARAMAEARNRKAKENSQQVSSKSEPPEGGSSEPAADESAEEADATSPGREPNRETKSEPDLDASPLIEPPSSWTDAPRQYWDKLDPAIQNYLVEYDKKSSSAVSRAQREATEQLKGLTAREQEMVQARQEFEQATQANIAALQQHLAGEFSDIRSQEDAKALAATDPQRYVRLLAHQNDIAGKLEILRQAQARQVEEHSQRFAKFAQEEDKKFIERYPEFADAKKAAAMQNGAIEMLKDIGFAEDELTRHWNGQEFISLHDNRVQSLIADAYRYRNAQRAAQRVSAKPLPPVQRPGVAPGPGDSVQAQIEAIHQQMRTATGMNATKLGARLQALRRQANSGR